GVGQAWLCPPGSQFVKPGETATFTDGTGSTAVRNQRTVPACAEVFSGASACPAGWKFRSSDSLEVPKGSPYDTEVFGHYFVEANPLCDEQAPQCPTGLSSDDAGSCAAAADVRTDPGGPDDGSSRPEDFDSEAAPGSPSGSAPGSATPSTEPWKGSWCTGTALTSRSRRSSPRTWCRACSTAACGRGSTTSPCASSRRLRWRPSPARPWITGGRPCPSTVIP